MKAIKYERVRTVLLALTLLAGLSALAIPSNEFRSGQTRFHIHDLLTICFDKTPNELLQLDGTEASVPHESASVCFSITASVVDIDPNGNIRLKAQRTVRTGYNETTTVLSGNKRRLQTDCTITRLALSGTVTPSRVRDNNTVSSADITDLSISIPAE
jgi:hypothetical protein